MDQDTMAQYLDGLQGISFRAMCRSKADETLMVRVSDGSSDPRFVDMRELAADGVTIDAINTTYPQILATVAVWKTRYAASNSH